MYDELNRLISASVAGTGGWGQTFTHDGFGNLWTQAVTKGTAPSVSLNLQMSTNRINSANWGYDDNGNTTQMPVVGGGTYDQHALESNPLGLGIPVPTEPIETPAAEPAIETEPLPPAPLPSMPEEPTLPQEPTVIQPMALHPAADSALPALPETFLK